MTRACAIGLLGLAVVAGCARPVHMAVAPGPHSGCRAAEHAAPDEPVVWIRPLEDDERRALDAKCAQVGRPVVPASAPHAPRAQRVLVATWNMHDGRGDVLALVDALRRGSPEHPAPDAVVVLLQEVVRSLPAGGRAAAPATGTSSGEVKDIPSIVGRLGWHLAYLPGRRNRLHPDGALAADRGVAILSSLPLTALEAIELPIERQRRVALSGIVHGTTTRGEAWHLRVVSVHLENRSGARRLWARAGASRTRQAEALIDALSLSPATGMPAPVPALVGGDFNVWLGPREEALDLLRRAFGTFASEDTRPTMQNAWRLDYLFPRLPTSMPATHRRLDALFGSDHYPVVATLDVGGTN
jgi:endonuclease/exonuclease/phosphatase family metal-dependent hydrolase